jgi:type II secretory pathway pseudopilin PulG
VRSRGFTLLELLAAVAITIVLAAIIATAAWKLYAASSLAVSANNIRSLAMGGMAYLADNGNEYWRYRQGISEGVVWWFGFETRASFKSAEGKREFDPSRGPLAGYVPANIRPDPSFALAGAAMKPKFRNGYIGTGYNTLIGGGWSGNGETAHQLRIPDPSRVVVFFTSAQVNTFQPPASSSNPMIEEFYGIDEDEVTVHFRHGGKAMVSFASGNAGFLPMDESTRDAKLPEANVGRFAPAGDTTWLE